jgi:hypothetical protein
MKLTICLAIRNGEDYINYINNLFCKIESKYPHYIIEYFIYENNSTDNTKINIINFCKNRNAHFLLEDIPNNNILKGISIERGVHMMEIRNKLKDFHGFLNSDYVLLLDCDVVFSTSTIDKLINSMNDEIAMISCFVVDYTIYNQNKILHYYDSFALITDNDLSYKETNNTCLFKTCTRCINIRKDNSIIIDENKLLNNDKLINVNSAFGSMSLIKTDIYNKVQWSNSICEHFSFCNEVKQYGYVIINPNIKIIIKNEPIVKYSNLQFILDYLL